MFARQRLEAASRAGFSIVGSSPGLCVQHFWPAMGAAPDQPVVAVLDMDRAYVFELSVAWPAEVWIESARGVRLAQKKTAGGPVSLTLPRSVFREGPVDLVIAALRLEARLPPVTVPFRVFVLPRSSGGGSDADGDCVRPRDGDCDDRQSGANPFAVELCGNRQDDDCNGKVDDCQLKLGQSVQVMWQGSWYRGSVLELRSDGHVKVHYTDYSDRWDEAVELSRVRTFAGE